MDTQEVLRRRPSSRQKADPQGAHRALVLLTACCGVFAGFGSAFVFTFGVFLKPLIAAFGWSRAQVSLGFTSAALTVAICSPLMGRLLDHYPARRVVIPCVAIYGLGFASLSLLTAHLAHFLALLVIMGIVGIGTTQLGYARVVSSWFDASRGRALAAVMAGSGAGSMVFPPFAQALISAYGWRPAYALLGGIVLLLGIPLAVAFLREPDDYRVAVDTSPARQPEVRTSTYLKNRAFVLLTTGLLLFSLATNGVTAHLAPLLTDRGFSPARAAGVLTALGFALLASKLTTGYLLDRFYAGRVVAILFLACAGGFLVIVFAGTIGLAYAGSLLLGVGMGAESDAVPYLLTRYFGLGNLSELYGYTWSAYACAGALGPLLMGAMFDRTGSYRPTLLVLCGFVFIAAVLFALLPKYHCPSKTPDVA